MKKIVLIFLSIVLSCNSNQAPDEELQYQLNVIESNAANLSLSDWDKIDSSINSIKTQFDANRANLTQAQIDSFNLKIGRYYALKIKHQVSEFKNVLKDTETQLKGAMQELLSDSISK